MFEILTVYHGGTEPIETPRVDVGRLKLDFGPGFYITDIYSQAKDWATKIAAERGKAACVNIYHLQQQKLLSLGKAKIFGSYNSEWLEFVTQSRLGNRPWGSFDYIEGGVADDRVVNTVRLYMTGYISAEDALSRLKYYKPTNQICILNQDLLDQFLTFIECENI